MRKWVAVGIGVLAYLWWRSRSSSAKAPALTQTPISDRMPGGGAGGAGAGATGGGGGSGGVILDAPQEPPATVPALREMWHTKWKDAETGTYVFEVTNIWLDIDAVEIDQDGMVTQITGSKLLDLIRQGVYVPA